MMNIPIAHDEQEGAWLAGWHLRSRAVRSSSDCCVLLRDALQVFFRLPNDRKADLWICVMGDNTARV